MGWSLGWDGAWNRFVGYGVRAFCDHPGCENEIDRGLSYVCGGEPYGGDCGCGLHFCGDHLTASPQVCARCEADERPFEPKPEHPEWVHFLLTDESWDAWRKENPGKVSELELLDMTREVMGE